MAVPATSAATSDSDHVGSASFAPASAADHTPDKPRTNAGLVVEHSPAALVVEHEACANASRRGRFMLTGAAAGLLVILAWAVWLAGTEGSALKAMVSAWLWLLPVTGLGAALGWLAAWPRTRERSPQKSSSSRPTLGGTAR